MLTLANIVAAVSCLKRLCRVAGAAAKLHLWAVISNPKHCGVAHVAATETVGEKQQLQDVIERFGKVMSSSLDRHHICLYLFAKSNKNDMNSLVCFAL